MGTSDPLYFVGLDLTSAYSAKPRAIDVAILDASLRCSFIQIQWPVPDLVRTRDFEAASRMLNGCLAEAGAAGVVWAIDGPQGLARQGNTMRACERALGAPGKTPDTLPSDRSGGKPFETYVRSSIDFFAALVGKGDLSLVGLDSVPVQAANLIEVFPGAEWGVLAGRKLAKKDTLDGLRLRRQALVAAGITGLPDHVNHDQADAAVGALIAWATRHRPDAISMVGEAPYIEDGVLREGYIAHFSQSLIRDGARQLLIVAESPVADEGRRDASGAESLEALRGRLADFARARDWDQFHNPKNLAMALSVEVAELVEHFQWLTAEQSSKLDTATTQMVRDEIGDVLIYLIRLGEKLGIDPLAAASDKLVKNELKYPADKVRGQAKKYSEY